MRHAIVELRNIEVELGAASKAPGEVGIDSGEMVEEPFATGKLVVGDLVILKPRIRLSTRAVEGREPR
jgi:hypothetical protein